MRLIASFWAKQNTLLPVPSPSKHHLTWSPRAWTGLEYPPQDKDPLHVNPIMMLESSTNMS